MGDFIDITQFSVAVSCFGLYCFLYAVKTRPSKSWESSSLLKRIVLFTSGTLLQIPVIISIIAKPTVVTDVLSTKPWTWKYLLMNYVVMLAFALVVYIVTEVIGGYNASKK